MMTKISMIAAMAKDRVIGKDNDMPWHMPADLAHFKKVTMGKPVIMGRKTFESIGRPLPGRTNIVITRDLNWQADGVEVAHSPELALQLVADLEEVMIIGGGNIYQQFLPNAVNLYLTFIDLEVEGDTKFPDWSSVGNWLEVNSESYYADEKNAHAYQFITLEKQQ